MTPAQWQKVKRLLDDALELRATERAAFLESLSKHEPEVHDEVASLLCAHEAQPDFLELPCVLGAANDAGNSQTSAAWIGRVLGSYRLIELIGEGGMGAIFRAVRADGLHDRPVAVKLIRSALSTEFFLRRFNEERRILGSLDHPNIARLLDGGASPEGVPYVVMEFVDGVPIDAYCAREQLSVRERLELFRLVCGAVQYAHQNLIVHRDLKPANILVTRDGQPKLLDFGIAKIGDPRQAATGDHSVTLLPILTPDFASPEQVRGASITTASDIYSLGVILYVLLTGERPYGGATRAPQEVMQAICETAPLKPSTTVMHADRPFRAGGESAANSPSAAIGSQRERRRLHRALLGDIDSIVLKALRKDPQERYGTVEQLSADIRRHLEGLPVSARRGTAGYQLRKFLARHVVGVAGAVAITAVLLGAMAVSVREARLARVQEARAEARFNDVRKLANSLIFDIHDSIRNLPGASPSRHLLINTALQYLDSLARESGGDVALEHELSAAYQRLGEIQGGFTWSENDRAGALNSYRHALALLQAEIAADPGNERARADLVATYLRLGDLEWLIGDSAAVLRLGEQALAESRLLTTAEHANVESQVLAARVDADYGHKLFRVRGDSAGALGRMRPDAARLESLWSGNPQNRFVSRTLSVIYYRTAEVWLYGYHYDEALSAAGNARRVLQAVLAATPEDADLRVNEAAAMHDSAAALMGLNRLEEAERIERAALAVVQGLAASDPKVAEYRGFVGMGLTRLGDIAARQGHTARAIELLQQGVQTSDAAIDAGTRHPYIRHENAQAAALLGAAYAMRASDTHRTTAQRRRDWQSAREWYARALNSFRALGAIWYESIGEARQASEQIQLCDRMLGGGMKGVSSP
jgi:eukaryotic-like serine/threonine-protein kinase